MATITEVNSKGYERSDTALLPKPHAHQALCSYVGPVPHVIEERCEESEIVTMLSLRGFSVAPIWAHVRCTSRPMTGPMWPARAARRGDGDGTNGSRLTRAYRVGRRNCNDNAHAGQYD